MKPYQLVCTLSVVALLCACSTRDDTVTGNAVGDESSFQDDDNNAATAPPQLSIENYKSRVSYALSFFANEQLPGPNMPPIALPIFSNATHTTTDSTTGITTYYHACSNGGEATREQSDNGLYTFTLSNCQVDDTVFNGQVSNSFGKYLNQNVYLDFVADINGSAAVREITGELINRIGSPPCNTKQRSRSVDYYKITQGDQIFEIKNWQTDFEQFIPVENFCEQDKLSVSGTFEVRSPETDNQWLTVTTTQNIEASDTAPLSGIVSIVAEDASSITLDAQSSSDETVLVQIVNKEGSVVFEQPFADWEANLLPN